MKKILQFLFILLFGTFCCACVNVFAVHELNNLAKNYMDDGDINKAISRLEASVELEGKSYESRYNLAVAYVRVDRCDEALEHVNVAKDLAKNEPAVYYMHGITSTCVADKILEKYEEGNHTSNTLIKYVELLQEANNSLTKYVQKLPNAEDSKYSLDMIEKNKEKIENVLHKINEL